MSALNLSRFVNADNTDVDWDLLKEGVHTGVRFLDNVIDATPYHFKENKENQKSERRIGLGTMGLAEMLIKLKIRYGSPESLVFLDKLYKFIAKEAYLASTDIAEEKGSFPKFELEKYLQSHFIQQFDSEVINAIKKKGIRNVTLLTQAPTGSTGTMVGTSTGIEPFFAFKFYRQSRLGFDEQYVPLAQEWIDNNPNKSLPDYFTTAMDLSAEDHVRVQAAVQKWTDSSISKTANAPNDFTIEDTKKLYELAFDLGCKGVTIYRDGSRDTQVLSLDKKEEKNEKVDGKKKLTKREHILNGKTYKFKTPVGTTYVTVNADSENKPVETIVNVGKAGTAVSAMAEALGRASSLVLRFAELPKGDQSQLLIEHFSGIGSSEQATGFGVAKAESIPDAIARALKSYLDNKKTDIEDQDITLSNKMEVKQLDICPSCNNFSLVNEDGCRHCINCGYSRCS